MEKKIKKVPYEEYIKFTKNYINDPNKTLRFGQAFINKFYPDTPSELLDSNLYESTMSIAMKIIYNNYLDFGE
jgi:hypothetical protein